MWTGVVETRGAGTLIEGVVGTPVDHARVGTRRGLLPDLPRPLRVQRAGRSSRGRWSRGTRRPRSHGYKGGDLLGIVEHLDDLAELGITALYLTPIFASASNHRYHTYDYLAVDPLLGGDAALRELLDAAHARGMRVVLDGVFNHCRPRLLAVPPRRGGRRGVALPRLVPPRRAGLAAGRRGLSPIRATTGGEQRQLEATGMGGRGVAPRAGLRGLVGPAGAAQAQHRTPGTRAHTC